MHKVVFLSSLIVHLHEYLVLWVERGTHNRGGAEGKAGEKDVCCVWMEVGACLTGSLFRGQSCRCCVTLSTSLRDDG